jgi:hypothetical protein
MSSKWSLSFIFSDCHHVNIAHLMCRSNYWSLNLTGNPQHQIARLAIGTKHKLATNRHTKQPKLARFEVLTAVLLKSRVWRDVTPCLWWVLTHVSEDRTAFICRVKQCPTQHHNQNNSNFSLALLKMLLLRHGLPVACAIWVLQGVLRYLILMLLYLQVVQWNRGRCPWEMNLGDWPPNLPRVSSNSRLPPTSNSFHRGPARSSSVHKVSTKSDAWMYWSDLYLVYWALVIRVNMSSLCLTNLSPYHNDVWRLSL